MMTNLTLIIGTLGMSLLLIAFVLNLLKKIMQNSVSYNILNIIGGGLLTYYAYVLNTIPFLVLESIWTIFAIYNLIIISRK